MGNLAGSMQTKKTAHPSPGGCTFIRCFDAGCGDGMRELQTDAAQALDIEVPACIQGKSRKRRLPPPAKTQIADPPFVLPQLAVDGAIAGAWAGLVAESALHPFDTISTRLKAQVTPQPKYNEGIRGLYGGIGATLLFQGPATAIYFGTYEFVKETSVAVAPQKYEPVVHLTAGALSELANSVVVVPMEVVKSRLQLGKNPSLTTGGWILTQSNYRNTVHAIVSIVRAEGLGGLYSGYRACLALDCSFSALQFALYEQLKKMVILYYKRNNHSVAADAAAGQACARNSYVTSPPKDTIRHADSYFDDVDRNTSQLPLRPWTILSIGAMAGGTAAFLTNPLDVVTARLMVQGSKQRESELHGGRGTFRGIIHCCTETFRHEGMAGFWKGSIPRVLSIAPLIALQFMVYEAIKGYLGGMDDFDFS